MQRITFVRYTTKPGQAGENERLSRAVFEQLRAERPDGIAYALCRKDDAFFHLFINFTADAAEPVTELATFKAFAERAAERQSEPPDVVRESVQVIEAYGFEPAMTPA